MPTYEYACSSCERRTEVVQKFTDPPLTTCEHCGGTLKRVFHPVGIVLKGSGFYSTDNRSGKSLGAPGKKEDSGGSESSSDSKKSDSSSKDKGSKGGGSKGASTSSDSKSKGSSGSGSSGSGSDSS